MNSSEKIKRLTRILNALNGKDDATSYYFDSAGVTLDGMMQNYSDKPTMKIFPQDFFTDEQIEKIEGMMEKDGLLKKEEKPKMKVWQYIARVLGGSTDATEEQIEGKIIERMSVLHKVVNHDAEGRIVDEYGQDYNEWGDILSVAIENMIFLPGPRKKLLEISGHYCKSEVKQFLDEEM